MQYTSSGTGYIACTNVCSFSSVSINQTLLCNCFFILVMSSIEYEKRDTMPGIPGVVFML